jgi:hypothetical protein
VWPRHTLSEDPTVTDLLPPPPPPPPSAAPKPLLRFDLRGVAGLVVGAIVLGALAFLIVTALGLQSRVDSLQKQLKSETESLQSADATDSALATANSADQQQIASLESQIPTKPDFQIVSSGWTKGCSSDSCYPEASVVNHGSAGEAVVIFGIYPGSPSTGSELAQCSASVPMTPANGTADGSCAASSAGLIQYFENNPTGEVSLQVSVQNP